MNDGVQVIPLGIELITASRSGMTDEQFTLYARSRLDESLDSQEDAYSLITALAFFAGGAITAWAEDTGREPEDVLRAIALDAASTDDAEGNE